MKRTIIVKPATKGRGSANRNLQFAYNSKGKVKVAANDYTFKHFPMDNNRPKAPSILFGVAKPFQKYEYEDGAGVAKQTHEDKKMMEFHLDFLAGHPAVWLVNGTEEQNKGKVRIFELIDERQQVATEITNWNKKLDAVNTIHGMTLNELRNVSYFYGQNPDGKTEQDLKLFLGNMENGYVLDKERIDDFTSHYIKKDNEDTEMIEVVRKAIKMGVIIVRKNGQVENYYLGQEIVGAAIPQVVAYMKTKPQLYKANVLSQVKEQDTFFEEEVKTIEETDAKPPEVKNQLNELRAECKRLLDLGHLTRKPYHKALIPTLKKWIAEGHENENKALKQLETVS